MSDLRIGLVVEGPTDFIVLEAALKAMLPGRSLIFSRLQPSDDLTFGSETRGAGWGGVLNWCLQQTTDLQNRLLAGFDLLVLHVDADVAAKHYSDVFGKKPAPFDDLPCQKPCPPASDTVDALRRIVLGWAGDRVQPHWVLCVPSKCVESWLVPVFFLEQQDKMAGLECNVQVEALFIRKKGPKLMRRRGSTYKKLPIEYRAISPLITERWHDVTQTCRQASHFERLVLAALTG